MKRQIDFISRVLKDNERKPIIRIAKEALHSMILEKDNPNHYFTSLLYKKGSADYRNYIGYKKIFKIQSDYNGLHNPEEKLENKIIFSSELEKNNIPTPKIINSNFNDASELNKDYLKRLVKNSKTEAIFMKPVDGQGGFNSFAFDEDSIRELNSQEIEHLQELVLKEPFFIQEYVNQHPLLNDVYPHSVNTMRVHTLKSDEGVRVLSAYMRFGRGGTVVDNGKSGGLFLPVDLDSWKLKGEGWKLLKQGGETFTHHPDSGIKLDGFQLPFREESIDIIKKTAKLFEKEFVGWDIAFTPKGPMIIEGNGVPSTLMLQMGVYGIKNHPDYKELFSNYI